MSYRVAPIFLIRLAGAPFESVKQLATPSVPTLARHLIQKKQERAIARDAAEKFFGSRERVLSPSAYHALLVAVRQNRPPGEVGADQPPIFSNYADAASAVAVSESKLQTILEQEVEKARSRLIEASRRFLPRYLLFGTEKVRGLLASELGTYPGSGHTLPVRNNPARKVEQSLLLYLQRIATKNDTFSEFGPSAWGKIGANISGITFAPEVGITKRDAFMERWTSHAIAAVINADPENSNPKLSVPALEAHSMEVLRDDVENWPPNSARDRWLWILHELVELSQKFSAAENIQDRQSILDEARTRLQSVGAEPKPGDRFLYAATNLIGEECFRECHFEINERIIDEVTTEAAPWIDLWRDNYAFIASRVAAGLRGIMEKAGAKDGVMPMPAFMQACEAAKLPLTGPGLIALAVIGFQEVKAAFRKRLQQHADLDEYELTTEDAHFVRDNFDYPKFDEYTYPSADLQLAAKSTDGFLRGEYQWLVSELHPPIALLHHGFYWACPDKPVLNSALARAAGNKPNFHFGFFAADFTAHTTVRLFDALPELSNFVAPQRANPKWRKILPSEAEVYLDETGDVCVRKVENREHLGSFARAWVIPLGFHPFQFSLGRHTPRLRCGKVIVQRRAWAVTASDLAPGKYTGVSSSLALAIEKLRAERNLPRFVYIRPTEQALRRSGAEGRDKDTKPVFIDLESYLFLEIFYRWLTKAGELEVTEMLPAPDQLLWQEPDGRHTFELRTLIVPRS